MKKTVGLQNKKTHSRGWISGVRYAGLKRRLQILESTWVQIMWVSLSYNMQSSSVVAQVVTWATTSNDADVVQTMKYRLANPTTRKGMVCHQISLKWSTPMTDRLGAWMERHVPELAAKLAIAKLRRLGMRDIVAMFIESAWDTWRKKFPELAQLQPEIVRAYDARKLGFSAHRKPDFALFKAHIEGSLG